MKYAELVQRIVGAALKEGLVDGVLAFSHGVSVTDVVPAMVIEEQDAGKITVVSCQPCSLVKLAKEYKGRSGKLGLVVRSCDARAMIELAKRKQVDLDDFYLIGVGCYGVVRQPEGELYVFADEIELDGQKKPLDRAMLSPNCLRCEYPVPTMADVSCGFDGGGASWAVANTEKGRTLLSAAGIEPQETDRDASADRERAIRQQEEEFGGIWAMEPAERRRHWFSQLEKCIKCYGCRNSCPICYCDDCYLGPERILVGREEYPPAKLFHVARLIHMGDSCVNCGQCEAACPMDIPVSSLFHMMSKELGSIFKYEAGMDLSSPPPMCTIDEEDLVKGGVDLD